MKKNRKHLFSSCFLIGVLGLNGCVYNADNYTATEGYGVHPAVTIKLS